MADATATPTQVTAVAALPTVNITASATVTPAQVAAVVSVPAAWRVVAVTRVAAVAAQPAVTVQLGVVVTPGVVAGLAGVLSVLIPVRAQTVAAVAEIDTPLVFSPYDRWRPRLRPDTTSVLLCCTQPGNHDSPAGFEEMTLWIFRANGHERTEVLGTPGSIDDGAATPTPLGWVSYGHPEWSPDGNDLVIFVETSSDYRIVVLDGNDLTVGSTLHTIAKPGNCLDPSYSPNGTTVVFTEKIGSTYYISTITVSATPVYTQLASSSDALHDPYFSPDGGQIVYTKQVGAVGIYGEWELKVMPAVGGMSTTILSDDNAHMHPWWVDSRTIVFQTYRYGTDTEFQVATISVDGDTPDVLGTGEYPQTVNI